MMDVREAEALRCTDLLKGDVDTVATLLDPALRYVHSTGCQDNAETLLTQLRSGATTYLALGHRIDDVREVGDLAALHGEMEMRIRAAAGEKTLNTLTLSLWNRGEAGWLLRDFQATAAR